jgi:hypothetical protein
MKKEEDKENNNGETQCALRFAEIKRRGLKQKSKKRAGNRKGKI